MKRLFAILFLLGFLLTNCEKESSNSSPPVDDYSDIKKDITELYRVQYELKDQFEIYTNRIPEFTDAMDSLELWLQNHPQVVSAEASFDYLFTFEHVNGKSASAMFYTDNTDPGLNLRGGGFVPAADNLAISEHSYSAARKIKNTNVLILNPFFDEFYSNGPPAQEKDIKDLIKIFTGSSLGFSVTHLKFDDAGIEAFADLENYGTIIFNTHGSKEGVMTGKKLLKVDTTSFPKPDSLGELDIPKQYALELRAGFITPAARWKYDRLTNAIIGLQLNYELQYSFFRNLNISLDESILLGNFCYSGINGGELGKVLASKGLKTFYGYSFDIGKSGPVTNEICWATEDTVFKSLILQEDTTGIAHLSNNDSLIRDHDYYDGMSKRFKAKILRKTGVTQPQAARHWLEKDYRYEDCFDTVFTDSRDGIKYRTVCIGEQTWMAENLKYAGGGVCYDGNATNCDTYGRLYSLFETTGGQASAPGVNVQGICPQGWHVPSQAEFQELIDFVGGDQVAGDLLAADTLWPRAFNDPYNFRLLPSGWWYSGTPGFISLGLRTGFWISDVYPGTAPGDKKYGLYQFEERSSGIRIYWAGVKIDDPATETPYKFSCRCVKD